METKKLNLRDLGFRLGRRRSSNILKRRTITEGLVIVAAVFAIASVDCASTTPQRQEPCPCTCEQSEASPLPEEDHSREDEEAQAREHNRCMRSCESYQDRARRIVEEFKNTRRGRRLFVTIDEQREERLTDMVRQQIVDGNTDVADLRSALSTWIEHGTEPRGIISCQAACIQGIHPTE